MSIPRQCGHNVTFSELAIRSWETKSPHVGQPANTLTVIQLSSPYLWLVIPSLNSLVEMIDNLLSYISTYRYVIFNAGGWSRNILGRKIDQVVIRIIFVLKDHKNISYKNYIIYDILFYVTLLTLWRQYDLATTKYKINLSDCFL